MKTEEQIIEEMQKDYRWKIVGDDTEIRAMQGKKFNAEVQRRLKIQSKKAREDFHKQWNQIYVVSHYLESEREKLMKHYNEDIHGKENWKSFEKAESIRYVEKLLGGFRDKLNAKHIDLQKKADEIQEKRLGKRCPKCDGACVSQGPDGEEESFLCLVCEYYFLDGQVDHMFDDDFYRRG